MSKPASIGHPKAYISLYAYCSQALLLRAGAARGKHFESTSTMGKVLQFNLLCPSKCIGNIFWIWGFFGKRLPICFFKAFPPGSNLGYIYSPCQGVRPAILDAFAGIGNQQADRGIFQWIFHFWSWHGPLEKEGSWRKHTPGTSESGPK